MSQVSANGATRLREMISGYMISQVVSVAAVLGLADLLGTSAMSAEALAEATGTHRRSLARLLRALVACDLLEQHEPESFRLTALGTLLRSDVPGSLRSLAVMHGGETTWRPWGELLHAVRTGTNAFEHVFGMGAFAYSALHPERAARFDAYMADLTQRSVAAIVAGHDFSRYRRIVDVGGGNGVLLSSILAAIPQAEGAIFDTAAGVEGARQRAEQFGVAGRCRIITGDFLAAIPEAADAYILKSVLHDWVDDRAAAILTNCRRAMRPDSVLLVVERLLPERTEYSDADREVVMMDMHMLVAPGGRERTSSEYGELFTAAGLILIGIRPTKSSPFVVMEVVPADALAACRRAQDGEEKR
jgi:SAM-dependent methyltransferase